MGTMGRWVHRAWSFFVSTNKSFPQIRRPFNKSARQPHRPRRRRIDRPALQPHRCRAGAYVYEYNVSLSGTPPPPSQGSGSTLHGTPRSQATGKIANRLHAPPSTPLPPLDCRYFLHP